jgi:LPXTG-motif cell wall-anchored protein
MLLLPRQWWAALAGFVLAGIFYFLHWRKQKT